MPTYEELRDYGELYYNGIRIGSISEAPVFTHTDKEDDETDFVMSLRSIDISDSRSLRMLKRRMRKIRQQAKRQVEKERKHKDA